MEKLKKLKILLFLLIFSLLILVVNSESEHDFSEAMKILEEKKPLNELSPEELEKIGDYFMELMLGNRHEIMDQMMGGEGSQTLRDMHINIALNNYDEYMRTGYISNRGMMGGTIGGAGMMSGYNGMMTPGYGSSFYGFGLLGFTTMILFWGFIIWLIAWLIRQNQNKNYNLNPKEIAKIRYANGKISKKEYEDIIKELKK